MKPYRELQLPVRYGDMAILETECHAVLRRAGHWRADGGRGHRCVWVSEQAIDTLQLRLIVRIAQLRA